MEFSDLSHQVIGCAIEVHRRLGPRLLESTYEACMAQELRLNGLGFKAQVAVPIDYKGCRVDCALRLDLLVENAIIVELKSVERLLGIHEAQILTYLKLTGKRQGFLINFNVKRLKNGLKSFVL